MIDPKKCLCAVLWLERTCRHGHRGIREIIIQRLLLLVWSALLCLAVISHFTFLYGFCFSCFLVIFLLKCSGLFVHCLYASRRTLFDTGACDCERVDDVEFCCIKVGVPAPKAYFLLVQQKATLIDACRYADRMCTFAGILLFLSACHRGRDFDMSDNFRTTRRHSGCSGNWYHPSLIQDDPPASLAF